MCRIFQLLMTLVLAVMISSVTSAPASSVDNVDNDLSVSSFYQDYSEEPDEEVLDNAYGDDDNYQYEYDTEEDKEIATDDKEENEISPRKKRALVFRPLFAYRQQQIKKQRIYPSAPSAPANRAPTYHAPGSSASYQQYNPYYYPYQYSQKYPYRSA